MLYYALIFLVVGVIAGALNMAGVAAVAVLISWILFLIGIVLLAIHVHESIRPGTLNRKIELSQSPSSLDEQPLKWSGSFR